MIPRQPPLPRKPGPPVRELRCPSCGKVTIRVSPMTMMAMPDPTCRDCRERRDAHWNATYAARRIAAAPDEHTALDEIALACDRGAARALLLVEMELTSVLGDKPHVDVVRRIRHEIEQRLCNAQDRRRNALVTDVSQKPDRVQ